MTTATDALGLDADTTVIILTCDELGFSYGVNSAIYAALRMHQATSASVMVPAPWARAAAAHYNGEDVGVHLTLNSELDQYRWGPITQSPSLLDGDGAFPRTIDDIWEHADTEEVRREWQAQIERAQLWGFTVGHLDAHLAGVELKPEFFDVYLDLAERYRLPIRLPAAAEERRIGFPFRALATERGVLAPDARDLARHARPGRGLASRCAFRSRAGRHRAARAPRARLARAPGRDPVVGDESERGHPARARHEDPGRGWRVRAAANRLRQIDRGDAALARRSICVEQRRGPRRRSARPVSVLSPKRRAAAVRSTASQ